MPHLNFTEHDWERVERDTMAWWAGELGRPLVLLATADPVDAPPVRGYQSNYPLDLPADDVINLYEPHLAASRYYGDAFPSAWLNFGPGMMAGFLGANVHSVTEPAETVWFSPREAVPVRDLAPAYDPVNPWWKRVRDLTAALVRRYGGLLQVAHTDLGGNLDILASLLGTEQLLFDVVEQPEAVLRQARRVTELWKRYYDELDAMIRPACRGTSCWTPIWSTGTTYMLQCDFSYMISPAMFERFVMPDLAACCDHLDHAFYHLDGVGEIPHLDLLLSIPRLRGIQWIPGDGQPAPDQWLPLLERIRDGGKRCQVFVSPAGAQRIARALGGKGFLFVIQHDGREFADPDAARAFVKSLR